MTNILCSEVSSTYLCDPRRTDRFLMQLANANTILPDVVTRRTPVTSSIRVLPARDVNMRTGKALVSRSRSTNSAATPHTAVRRTSAVAKDMLSAFLIARPCKWFLKGNCFHGDNCTYLHEYPSGEGLSFPRRRSRVLTGALKLGLLRAISSAMEMAIALPEIPAASHTRLLILIASTATQRWTTPRHSRLRPRP